MNSTGSRLQILGIVRGRPCSSGKSTGCCLMKLMVSQFCAASGWKPKSRLIMSLEHQISKDPATFSGQKTDRMKTILISEFRLSNNQAYGYPPRSCFHMFSPPVQCRKPVSYIPDWHI